MGTRVQENLEKILAGPPVILNLDLSQEEIAKLQATPGEIRVIPPLGGAVLTGPVVEDPEAEIQQLKELQEKLNDVANNYVAGVIEDRKIKDALADIKDAVEKKHAFTHVQMDIGIEMSLMVLAPPDQKLFREVAQQNGIPLWQALWGQFKRCEEWSLAFTPILDPGWTSTDVRTLGPRICPICGKEFQPKDWGQVFDFDICGSEDERRKRDVRLDEEERERQARMPQGLQADAEKNELPQSSDNISNVMEDEVPAEVLR